jgi:hypothetical protein
MIAIQQRFHVFLIAAGIVLSTALGGCGGGAAESTTAVDGTTITAGQPNVSFIYISTTAGTNKQANLSFSVSKKGTPQPNIGVTVTLNDQALAAGAKFFGGATSLSLTTDSSGNTATFSVISGAIPTSIVVKGVLSNNVSIADYSSAIAVSSGGADQDRFSIANANNSIEGWDYLGTTTTTTVQLADRLGNPVPDGTSVNFSVSPGIIVSPTTCTTAASACSVTLTTANAVGRTPFVTVLAFAQGEESFIDTNGNNTYDANELFTDLGKPYRDDNQNSVYDSGIDQSLNVIGTGLSNCPSTTYSAKNSVPLTCNGTRDSNAIVRASAYLYVAPSNLVLAQTSSTADTYTYELYGTVLGSLQKYRAPSGTSITAAVVVPINGGNNCAATMNNIAIDASVNNALIPSQHTLTYTTALCAGRQALITVTTPKGRSFNYSVNL